MRLKVRLRHEAKVQAFLAAKQQADIDVVPAFRRYVNTLKFKDRLTIALKILKGKY